MILQRDTSEILHRRAMNVSMPIPLIFSTPCVGLGSAQLGACTFSFLPPQVIDGYQIQHKLLRHISSFHQFVVSFSTNRLLNMPQMIKHLQTHRAKRSLKKDTSKPTKKIQGHNILDYGESSFGRLPTEIPAEDSFGCTRTLFLLNKYHITDLSHSTSCFA
jgi:hypothetical protein